VRVAFVALMALTCLEACEPVGATHNGLGDPTRGKTVITSVQCGACHQIPGVVGADGQVGPPLASFGRRTIIAGVLPNTPANLVHWLQSPQSVKPGDAMPDTGLTDQEANDAAAYISRLY